MLSTLCCHRQHIRHCRNFSIATNGLQSCSTGPRNGEMQEFSCLGLKIETLEIGRKMSEQRTRRMEMFRHVGFESLKRVTCAI